MRLFSEKEISDILNRTITNEEKENILKAMSEQNIARYENAMSDYEVYKYIEEMGRRRWRKLSILEKSCFATTKEDILYIEKLKQSGESLLERSCYMPPKEKTKTLYKTADDLIIC